MVSTARRTTTEKNLQPQHVVFVQVTPTSEFPILPDSIDCIISTWSTSQLVPDIREKFLSEIFRVIKAGGRIVLKDVSASLLSSHSVCEVLTIYCRPPLSPPFRNLCALNWLQTPYTYLMLVVFMVTWNSRTVRVLSIPSMGNIVSTHRFLEFPLNRQVSRHTDRWYLFLVTTLQSLLFFPCREASPWRGTSWSTLPSRNCLAGLVDCVSRSVV